MPMPCEADSTGPTLYTSKRSVLKRAFRVVPSGSFTSSVLVVEQQCRLSVPINHASAARRSRLLLTE